jgi:hypothetical protein
MVVELRENNTKCVMPKKPAFIKKKNSKDFYSKKVRGWTSFHVDVVYTRYDVQRI